MFNEICAKFNWSPVSNLSTNGDNIQLSDEKNYEGGDLEFGITDETGKNNHKANRTRGSITIFPAFLSHRVTPITKGTRHSLITWMLGDCFV